MKGYNRLQPRRELDGQIGFEFIEELGYPLGHRMLGEQVFDVPADDGLDTEVVTFVL